MKEVAVELSPEVYEYLERRAEELGSTVERLAIISIYSGVLGDTKGEES